MTRWPHLVFIAGAVGLMQWHSGWWWFEQVGPSGPAWSLAVEGAALWLWWQGGRPAMAVLASAVLIAGPLLHLSEPVQRGLQQARTGEALVASYRAEVSQLEASITRYDGNSAKRLGWAERIDRIQAALDAARHRLREAVATRAESTPDWRAHLTVALQAAALMLVMITQIHAVRTLRPELDTEPPTLRSPMAMVREKRAAATLEPARAETSKPACSAADHLASETDRLAEQVAAAMETDMQGRGETQAALARRLGVRPADVSMIRNHAKRRNAGKETVSSAVLKGLATHYEIHNEKR